MYRPKISLPCSFLLLCACLETTDEENPSSTSVPSSFGLDTATASDTADDSGDAGDPSDRDADGVIDEEDCDDTDPSLGARAEDADCDGILTEADCDDADVENTDSCSHCEGSYTLTDEADTQEAVRYCWSVDDLILEENHMTTLEVLHNLETVDNFLYFDATQLLGNMEGLERLRSVLNLQVEGARCMGDLNGLENIGGTMDNVYIVDNLEIRNIDALSGITGISEVLSIEGNASIFGVDGLSGITHVDGYLRIRNNRYLDNLDGLDALTHVGISIDISDNPALCQSTVDAFVARLEGESIAVASGNKDDC